MTPRELVVLVEGLSETSKFKRSQVTAWTLSERLLAAGLNVAHGQREDYRNAHDAPYDWTPAEPPELEHERRMREARERADAQRAVLGPAVLERMLRGELRMTDIDISRPIEEVLTA